MHKKDFMLKNPIIKNILSAVAVVGFGFVLLNLTFIFFAAVGFLITFLVPGGLEAVQSWIGPVSFAVSTLFIAIFSWLIFRSGWPTLVKAIYMTVPTAVVLVLDGILFYRWPIIANSIGTLLVLATLYFFYRTEQPWLYFFSVILVSLALLIMGLSGTEI